VCTDESPARLAAPILHDVEPAIEIDLEPVDSVVVTTLMDNVTDMLLPDQGPAHRIVLGAGPLRPSTTMVNGLVPSPLIAEHGFSVLVTVAKGGAEHRFLFDTGASPDGIMRNMHQLDIDPGSIEAVVCSPLAGPGEHAGADPPPLLAAAAPGPARPGPDGDSHHQPSRAGRGGLRHHRGAAAELPVRPVRADHR
jgi:hypothetical protein